MRLGHAHRAIMPPYSLKPSWVKQGIDPCNFKRFLEKLILMKDSE